MLIQHPAVLSENMVSLYFFLSPQRCRISHRRQCASLLHWNLTIPPSLWPDRELRKYHCPCLALTPPPVAIRHLLLRNRYRPDGLHCVQSKICFTKFAWFFPRTLKLIICSFRMNNQHFNFWSSNDIYHVNFLLICFTQPNFLSARIQNPYHRNLLIESLP